MSWIWKRVDKSIVNIFLVLSLAMVALLLVHCGAPSERGHKSTGGTHPAPTEVVFHFAPGTLELITSDVDTLCAGLDSQAEYRLEGYPCEEDGGSNEELLAAAQRRAEKVRDLLVERGFSPSRLTTVAYGRSNDCSVIVIEVRQE